MRSGITVAIRASSTDAGLAFQGLFASDRLSYAIERFIIYKKRTVIPFDKTGGITDSGSDTRPSGLFVTPI